MAHSKPIPMKNRKIIANDPFMKVCIYKSHGAPNHDCSGRIEWEHSSYYNGRINDPWAILPCCSNHNGGMAIVKDYNQYRALLRAKELLPNGLDTLMQMYPKFNWIIRFNYLDGKYGN